MKLICEKCRRVVVVRKRDVDELYLCIECWRPLLAPPGHADARHLVCPFCTVEGNGVFHLDHDPPSFDLTTKFNQLNLAGLEEVTLGGSGGKKGTA